LNVIYDATVGLTQVKISVTQLRHVPELNSRSRGITCF